MINEELYKKLNQLKIEDFIWGIYIIIIIASWYSNVLERKYFVFNDLKSKNEYRKIIIVIFSVLLVIYFYFLINSFDDLKNIKTSDSQKKKDLTYLSFLGSLFIVLSGISFLYIALMDEDLNVELAFN